MQRTRAIIAQNVIPESGTSMTPRDAGVVVQISLLANLTPSTILARRWLWLSGIGRRLDIATCSEY